MMVSPARSTPTQSNFLPVPSKQAEHLEAYAADLLAYIGGHFRDAHPEAFKGDVGKLVDMRREWVEPKVEAHPEIARGLMKYYAQLAFVATKFPSDIGLSFAYRLPFPPPFSITPDAPISLPSFTYERASVLYNIAAINASLAAAERRADAESIKRALAFLTTAAGVFNFLITSVLPDLKSEVTSAAALGYDMSESFLTTMREFVLGQAQECYWQQAVLQGSYRNSVIAKLSMKVSEYYKSALKAANSIDPSSASYFPQAWINNITVKSMHFEAAAQYRLSKDDLEKARYGDEIARLRIAEGLAKKGLDLGKKSVAESVLGDLKNLSDTVKTALDRAVRDNDLVYLVAIPSPTQLPPLTGAGMVKLATPTEISEPIAWLMSGKAGMPPLFSALVPYGVHVALSIYDDRKDTVIREMDGKREELDGVAASTLQSLSLPGSLQALERPIGLPPSLIKKAEEVDAAGGVDKIRSLFMDVQRLSKSNAKLLSDAWEILDQEAHETEQLLERQPHLAETRPPSHVANQHLIGQAHQWEDTIKQAAASDATVRAKWEEWRNQIEILAGGEDIISDHVPSTTSSGGGFSALPSSVRPLRASLEELDDRMAHRATLVQEARQMAAHDDVRPEVLQEASRLAHGGSGDVKPEWFEPIFEKALAKYDNLRDDMTSEADTQDELLEQIRQQNDAFIAQRKDDPRVQERQRSLQNMDIAYWKWREIIDNAEEGIKFYNSLAQMLHQFNEQCSQFLNARRVDVGQLTQQFQNTSFSENPNPSPNPSPPQWQSPPAPTPPRISSVSPPAPAPAPSFLANPNSSQWQSATDLLPPPPPQPVLRSGGVPRPAPPPPVDSPRRATRASTRNQAPIGDPNVNPYKKGTRGGGEGVI